MSGIEVFATGIKIKSSTDEGIKVTSELRKSKDLTFDPQKNQQSRAFRDDQAIKHTFLAIKNLDPGRKRFNRWHVSEYVPWSAVKKSIDCLIQWTAEPSAQARW